MCFIFHCFKHSSIQKEHLNAFFVCQYNTHPVKKYHWCTKNLKVFFFIELLWSPQFSVSDIRWMCFISLHAVYLTFSSLSLKDTHWEDPQCFTQQQRSLAASDLLHILTYSIKFYTLHFHIWEYSCFKNVIYQIDRKWTVASFRKFCSKIWVDFCLNDAHRVKLTHC